MMKETLLKLIEKSQNRVMFCIELINEFNLNAVAEIGVYKGDFAKQLLEKSNGIKTYTMIDPWRNLSDWNKPCNKDNNSFENFYKETINKTDFAKEKRKVLRGKTTEVIDELEDESFDFVYIDGDHTLRGITIDLINFWPKLKPNGFIVGDDFSPSIWQHNREFEPTMVFPFAVYFAEAVNTKIFGLNFNQFLIAKNQTEFQFIDLTSGKYKNLELRTQFNNMPNRTIKQLIQKNIPFLK